MLTNHKHKRNLSLKNSHSNTKPYAVIQPKGLDLSWLIEKSIIDFDYHLDFLKYIIHHIYSEKAKRIESFKKQETANIPIPLSSLKLQKLNYNYRKHIRYLGKIHFDTFNILFRTNYIIDQSSYKYTLGPYFKNRDLSLSTIQDYKLINKIKQQQIKIAPKYMTGSYYFLTKYFNKDLLTLNLSVAMDICYSRYTNNKNYSKYLKEANHIVELYNGIYRLYYSPDTDGRVHSNITRLGKPYRKVIRYNGKSLVEVDLSNSIPFFLAITLDRTEAWPIDNNIVLLPYMFKKTVVSPDSKEIELMKKISSEGRFYEHFIDGFVEYYSSTKIASTYEYYFEDKFNGTFEHTRKVVKKSIVAMIFGKVEQLPEVENIFSHSFPTILKYINAFKTKYGYKKLSHCLFQLEAHFMIDKIARSFNKEYWRKAPVFTLHDCLITTEDYATELESHIKDSFIDMLGVSPRLKLEHWN